MAKRTVHVTGKPPHVITVISAEMEATMTISEKNKPDSKPPGKPDTPPGKPPPVSTTPPPIEPPPVVDPPPVDPPPVDPPPVTGSVPDSVAKPVQGKDLTEVWNLQFGGTGPRSAPSNGKWSGALDAYLSGAGVVMGNTGALYWYIGANTAVLEKYDFTGAPKLNINGTGSATVRDCTFGETSGMACPIDVNANLGFDTTTLKVLMDHCTFDKATFYQGAGELRWSYCRFKNQVQGLGDSGYLAAGIAILAYDHCYITGGGVKPAQGAHVELSQMVRNTLGCMFSITNTLIDLTKDGQPTAAKWGSGWTAAWSIGAIPIEISGNIMIGGPAINANPANPDVFACLLAYGIGSTPTITDNVFEPGLYGYTHNGNGATNRPVDGGGNRTFDNQPITAAQFG